MDELDRQRAAFKETLGGLQTAATANTEGIADIKTAVGVLKDQMREFGEAQVAANQPSPSGSEADLDVYTRGVKPVDVDGKHYIHNRDKDVAPVRLYGHYDRSGVFRPGFLDDAPRTQEQAEVQRLFTQRAVVRAALRKPGHERASDVKTPLCDEMLKLACVDMPGPIGEAARIFSDTDSLESWFANSVAPGFERDLELTPRLAPIFPTRPIAPGGTTKQRYRSKRLLAFKGTIPSVNDPENAELSDTTFADRDIDPVECAVATQNHRDATEDSLIMDSSLIAADLRWGLAAMDDQAILHGDTAATHQDAIASWNTRDLYTTADAAKMGLSNDFRKAWIGLRARAFDVSNTTDQNSAQTVAGIRAARNKLQVEHAMGDIVIVVSPEYFIGKMLAFSEMLTWDKVGAGATVLTGLLGLTSGALPGQVGFVHNIPVIVNWFMTGDLASTGLFTGSGTTTGMLIFSRNRFERWVRKGVTIESAVDIRNNTVTTVARKRDVFRTPDGSTVKNVHFSKNLTF